MERKQAVITPDDLTKEQIRELGVKALAGLKNSYAPILISMYLRFFLRRW